MSGEVVYVRVSPEVQGGISIVMEEYGWNRTRTVEALLRKALGIDGHGLPEKRSPEDIAREGMLAGIAWTAGILASIARNSDKVTGSAAVAEIHKLVQDLAEQQDPAASVLPWERMT